MKYFVLVFFVFISSLIWAQSNEENYMKLGDEAIEKKDYETAIIEYSRVIRINPNNVSAYISRGVAYHRNRNEQAALSDFSKAISLDPNDELAYLDRANTYFNLARYEDAIKDTTRLIESSSYWADKAYLIRGLSYNNIDDLENAITDLEKYLSEYSDPEIEEHLKEIKRISLARSYFKYQQEQEERIAKGWIPVDEYENITLFDLDIIEQKSTDYFPQFKKYSSIVLFRSQNGATLYFTDLNGRTFKDFKINKQFPEIQRGQKVTIYFQVKKIYGVVDRNIEFINMGEN
jgi:tetratricopeptide (TPR) repeat protein